MGNSDDVHRLVGSLCARMDSVLGRLDRIENKIDDLQSFKFKLLGATAAMSVIVSLAIGLARVH